MEIACKWQHVQTHFKLDQNIWPEPGDVARAQAELDQLMQVWISLFGA